MSKPSLPIKKGTAVNVGGCTGKITAITDTTVTVSGVYVYCDGTEDDPGYHEPWSNTYALHELAEVTKVWMQGSEKHPTIWDAKDVKCTRS